MHVCLELEHFLSLSLSFLAFIFSRNFRKTRRRTSALLRRASFYLQYRKTYIFFIFLGVRSSLRVKRVLVVYMYNTDIRLGKVSGTGRTSAFVANKNKSQNEI